MDKKTIQRSIETAAGGRMVSITEIAAWSGRSVEWVKGTILADLDSIKTGKHRLYYVGDVAQAFVDAATRR